MTVTKYFRVCFYSDLYNYFIIQVFCSLTSSFYSKQTRIETPATEAECSKSSLNNNGMSDSTNLPTSSDLSSSASETYSLNQNYLSSLGVLCILGKKYSLPIGISNTIH